MCVCVVSVSECECVRVWVCVCVMVAWPFLCCKGIGTGPLFGSIFRGESSRYNYQIEK
jgi:hypothetical protein